MEQEMVLEVKDVDKSFGDVRVLKGVNLGIRRGEIHALMGENGAGKSTIIKIISGAYTKDKGTIMIDGTEVEFADPKEAMDAGIRVIHQEIHTVKTLTVAENIFLGNYPQTQYGGIDWKKLNEKATEVLGILGESMDVRQKVEKVSIAGQQMIEIAKALSVEPKILIMDEPTAALNDQETEKLFQVLDRLRQNGVSIIYITHRFSEVYRLAERVTVMRDGETVGVLPVSEMNDDVLIRMMVGQEKDARFVKRKVTHGEELFRIEGLAAEGQLKDIN